MASSQIAYAGSDVVVTLNVIDSTGTHQAATGLNASRLSSHPSAVPVVTNPNSEPGVYVLTWSSLSPATSEGDSIVALIEGSVNSTPFSTYAIPLKVIANERGTDSVTSLDAAGVRTAVGLASANLDTQLSNINTQVGTIDGIVDDILVDTGTDIPASIAALNDFDPTTDTVANVTTVGSVTNAVTTDTASRDASKADVSALATAASIAALNDFDPTTDTVANVTTVGSVTNPVATDAASRTASQADVSLLSTAADLAVVDSNVGAVKAKTDQLAFTVANQVDANALTGGGGDDAATIYSYFTSGSNEDAFKADVSGLSTFDPTTQSVTVGTNNDKTGYALSSAANDAIGAAFLAYTLTKGTAGTIERAFWQALKATQLADGEVSGTPTASAFDTNLSAVTGAYDHLLLLFTSGSLAGEARPIATYNSTNGRITLQEALTSAPSSADEFIVVPDHSHPVSEIVEGIFSEPQAGYTTAGTFGYYLDSQVSAAGGAVDTAAIADAVWDESRTGHTTLGTFGYYLDAQVSTAGAGGSGLYQVTVNVQNDDGNALQGARINVDGTVLTLTTDSSGIVTFNLDSGVYLLNCSPPAGYDTPTSLVATVTTSDISSTFTLTATAPSGDCDIPWVG